MQLLKRLTFFFVPILLIYGLLFLVGSGTLAEKIKTGLISGGYIAVLLTLSASPSIIAFKTKYFTKILLSNILIGGLNVLNSRVFNLNVLIYVTTVLNLILLLVSCRLVFYVEIDFKENELKHKIAGKMFGSYILKNLLFNGITLIAVVVAYMFAKDNSILMIIVYLIYFIITTFISLAVFSDVIQNNVLDMILKLENITSNKLWWWIMWRTLVLYFAIAIFTAILDKSFADGIYPSITKILDSVLFIYAYYMFFKLALLSKHDNFSIMFEKYL